MALRVAAANAATATDSKRMLAHVVGLAILAGLYALEVTWELSVAALSGQGLVEGPYIDSDQHGTYQIADICVLSSSTRRSPIRGERIKLYCDGHILSTLVLESGLTSQQASCSFLMACLRFDGQRPDNIDGFAATSISR